MIDNIRNSFSYIGCHCGKHIIYQRYVQTIMVTLGLLLLCIIRYTSISYRSNMAELSKNRTECRDNVALLCKEKWSEDHVFQIQYWFQFGYMLSHIPGGVLSDLQGGKYILAFSVLFSGVLTLIFPFVLEKTEFRQDIMLEFVHGLIQGVSVPAAWNILAHWLPKARVTVLASIANCSTQIGYMLGTTVTIHFIHKANYWRGCFFVWPPLTAIWFAVYLNLVFSMPKKHPFVSTEEKEKLTELLGFLVPRSIPWKRIMRDMSVWAMVVGNIGDTVLQVTVTAAIPDYIESVNNIVLGSHPPYLIAVIMLQFTFLMIITLLADSLINGEILAAVYVRSIYTLLGSVLSSILLLLGAFSRTHYLAASLFFITSLTINWFIMGGTLVNALDRTRNYAGFVKGLENGIPIVFAEATTHLIDKIGREPTSETWVNIFWFNLAVNVFTTILYLKWCKADRAKWDVVESDEEIRQKKLLKEDKALYKN